MTKLTWKKNFKTHNGEGSFQNTILIITITNAKLKENINN